MANPRQQDQQMQQRPATPVFTDRMAQQDIQQQRDETAQAFGTQAAELLKDKRTLFGSERKDSAEMTAVKNALEHVNHLLQVKIPSDEVAFAQQCAVVEQAYAALANHCSNYVAKRHPLTPHGRTRLRMVRQLLAQVKREQPLLASCAQEVFMRGPSSRQADWGTVLWQMRTAQLDTAGYQTTNLGGGSSVVLRIQHGNERIYFKPVEKRVERTQGDDLAFDIVQNAVRQNQHDKILVDTFLELQKKAQDAVDDVMTLGQYLVNNKRGNLVDEMTQDDLQQLVSGNLLRAEFASLQKGRALCRLAVMVARHHTLETFCDTAKIDQGATISTRNVATTRMAKLLGIEDMVAQSRTVMLTHEGREMLGNVMREAKGKTLEELQTEAERQNLVMEYSPNALRQLMILQMFDVLCGQIDRNQSNFLFEHEDKGGRRVLTRLTAIDNDLAFGRLTFRNVLEKPVEKLPQLCDPQNQDRLLVPGVDEAFYHRLSALGPQALHYALADVLSDGEINALCERLAGIRKMIEDNVADGTASLLQPDDWAGQMVAFANVQDPKAVAYITHGILSEQVARQAAATTTTGT